MQLFGDFEASSIQSINLQESVQVGVPVESGFLTVKISNFLDSFEETAHAFLARDDKIFRVSLLVNFFEVISRVLTSVLLLQQSQTVLNTEPTYQSCALPL